MLFLRTELTHAIPKSYDYPAQKKSWDPSLQEVHACYAHYVMYILYLIQPLKTLLRRIKDI